MIRILVDGYSLLHHWRELIPGQPPHSAAARDELTRRIRQFSDAEHLAVTIVFDGSQPTASPALEMSSAQCEIIYSKAGQTADDIIERLAHLLKEFGEVMVVTDDHAERDTVTSLGGMISSCDNFVRSVEAARKNMNLRLKHRQIVTRQTRPFNPIPVDKLSPHS